MSAPFVRRASAECLPAMLAIYNHYVVNSAITFDIEPLTSAGTSRC
jgi:L-amino acid N-acyltransferase YncA